MPTVAEYFRSAELKGADFCSQLRLLSFTGREEISRPFRYELTMAGVAGPAEDGSLDPDKVLGQSLTVVLKLIADGSQQRFFHGVVTEFAHAGYDEGLHRYTAVLRPSFWLLTQSSDYRILLDKSTPDIFKEVCHGAGVNFTLKLGSYEKWEQRVQYRESDFDFLSRLLEHEGIFYYFEHSSDRHTMVLVDDVAKLTAASGFETVKYHPAPSQVLLGYLTEWSTTRVLRSNAFVVRDYDFEHPSGRPQGSSQVPNPKPRIYEVFEYPAGAEPPNTQNVDRLAKLRAQRMQAMRTVSRASGDVAGLAAGRVFKLDQHPSGALNRKYIVLAADIRFTAARASADGTQSIIDDVEVKIEALDAQEPFRPERITPKPAIYGTQTAVVVGDGQELVTDKFGRTKVEFFWDRGKSASAWARVAQGWAGKNWGMQFLPRVGQEVVVSFLDGDPDRPLIIGSVYNQDVMPPYALPDNKTQSGIRSRSAPDGTADNFNELRFDDKKGEEEVYLHAEKNLKVVVENDQTISIGETKKDKGDRTVAIHNDDSLTVGHDRKVVVKNELDTTVKGEEKRTLEKSRKTTVSQNDALDVKQKLTLSAGQELTLKVGSAQIVLKSDGSVEISGNTVKVSGKMKTEVDGQQTAVSGTQLDIKGTKTAVEGSGMLDLTSSGIATLKGSLTKIG